MAIGDTVAGKYRVTRILAAGGMGVIAVAQHEALGQTVAIKLLAPEAMAAHHAVSRFLREARAAALIQSDHVARVFDCGTLPDGVPYMVMEFLPGHDLAEELKRRGPLPVGDAVDVLLQALEGVAEAHALGIVHRDLKPANLFLVERQGRPLFVKVLDFGISKFESGADAEVDDGLTATSTMLGSPRYMSPEQAQSSKHVDARTDVWSVGVVLYEILDGKSPFAGNTMGETIGRILLHKPPPIRDKRPDVPEGLEAVIDRCLQRDRDRRFRNVAELALALAPFGAGRSRASVDRITSLLVEGRIGAAGAALPARLNVPEPTGPMPPLSEPTVEEPTAVMPSPSSAVTGASARSAQVSAPEPTGSGLSLTGAYDKPRKGRALLVAAAAGAGAALVGVLAWALVVRAQPDPAASPAAAVSPSVAAPPQALPVPSAPVAPTTAAQAEPTAAPVTVPVVAKPAPAPAKGALAPTRPASGSVKSRPKDDILGSSD